jgi:hypothetical protein
MTTQGINTFNEKALHLDLKAWYAQPDDQFEVPVDGYIIDLVRADLLVEIQTRNFAAIRPKLIKLLPQHPIRLVFPIAQEKWIVKLDPTDKQIVSRRKSPKYGTIEHIFHELVHIPTLLLDPNFSLEVLLIREEETRRPNENFRWRRRPWITQERRLLQVVGHYHFATPCDLAELLPPGLSEPFTTSDLAAASVQPRALAQKMAYCLAKMGVLQVVGKQRNTLLYQVQVAQPDSVYVENL